MIDLDRLAGEAFSEDTKLVTVERTFLALVHNEIQAGRVAQATLDQIFNGKEPAPCTAAASAK